MSELQAEYGSISPIRWANAICLNDDGTECMCDCGKPVSQITQYTSGFTLALCNECSKEMEKNA